MDAAVCSGCRACEMTCSFAHEDAFSPSLARVRVTKIEDVGFDRPVLCRQCARPACREACPVGAIAQDGPEGNLRVNLEECIGCGQCVEACPFGAMHLHPETGLALVCDLCGGDPECVRRCTTHALVYGEGEDIARQRREKRAHAAAAALAAEAATAKEAQR